MEGYRIAPWQLPENADPSATLTEFEIPPELEELAREVVTNYDMQVSQMSLITSKPDKGGAIWRLQTNRGPRSLKVLHREPQRSLFSIAAQEYLVNKGARVPALIPTNRNQLYLEAGGKLWIVTDWIEPLTQLGKMDLPSAAALCYGLGEFHRHSRGFVPPPGAAKSSRLYKWETHYDKMVKKIGWFRDLALAYPETAASSSLLAVVDKYENQAIEMLERFRASPYRAMIQQGEPHWGLAHQDYGWSNGQLGPDGVWVIDLDGVAYDLPIRDLRKIITSTMDDMGTWDLDWIRGVIDAYHRANPIDQETFRILWIDMAFPNEFYKHVKEIVYDPLTFMDTELDGILQRIESTEANKWEVLSELEKDASKYPAGDYSNTTEPAAAELPDWRIYPPLRIVPAERPAIVEKPVAKEPASAPKAPKTPTASKEKAKKDAKKSVKRSAKRSEKKLTSKALKPRETAKSNAKLKKASAKSTKTTAKPAKMKSIPIKNAR